MKTVVVLLLLSISLMAQDARPPAHHADTPQGARVVTMTRPMATVSRLENELDEALAKHDQNTISELVKDDFSLWTPGPSPVPREDWLKQAAREVPMQRRNLAVEALSSGDVYVASFVAASEKHPAGAAHFIVDVWTKNGDSYQLVARYQAAVVKSAKTAPRPTGKD